MPKRKKPTRNPSPSAAHQNALRKRIKELEGEGAKLESAALPGHEQPDPIGKDKRRPDAVMTKRGKPIILESEDESKLGTQHHKDQMGTFRRSASQRGGRAEIVPFKKKKSKKK